jgi:hypothetical protein
MKAITASCDTVLKRMTIHCLKQFWNISDYPAPGIFGMKIGLKFNTGHETRARRMTTRATCPR